MTEKNTVASNTTNQHIHIPWGPVAAVVVTVLTYLFSQVLAALIIWIYPTLMGWDQARTNEWVNNSVYVQFFFVLIVEALTLWFLWLFLKKRRAHVRQIGLKNPKVRDVGYALVGLVAYFSVYVVILTILQQVIPSLNTDQKQELGFSTDTSGIALVAVFFSLVVLPPIVEEIMTRGFLYTGLRTKLPKLVAAMVTSVMFAIAHLQFGSGKALLWVAALDTFILSMILVYLREKTDSLWSPFIVHGLKNGIAFVSLFILKIS